MGLSELKPMIKLMMKVRYIRIKNCKKMGMG